MMQRYSEKEFNNRHGTIIPVPLYQLVRGRILLELYRNSYPAGSVLGTEGDLCRKFQVSRKTIRHAVHELEQAGYLKRKQKVGVIVTEKDLQARPPQSGTRKVILLLPKWNYTIGNRLERIIAHHLEMPEPPGQAFDVEMRLFHDPLPEEPDNLYAIIAADPPLEHLSALERFVAGGVLVITIEPRTNLHMSVNIRPDIPKAAHDAVGCLYRHGHRRIGLLSQACIHFTFQQWLEGFLHAMSEYELPVLPRAILRNEELAECADSDLRRITAWLCPTQSNVECLSYRLRKLGLSVPGDVSIIGSDDPSGTELSEQKFPVTVYMPYSGELAHLLRRLLEMDAGTVTPGSVLYYPMTVIHRQSVGRCRL